MTAEIFIKRPAHVLQKLNKKRVLLVLKMQSETFINIILEKNSSALYFLVSCVVNVLSFLTQMSEYCLLASLDTFCHIFDTFVKVFGLTRRLMILF